MKKKFLRNILFNSIVIFVLFPSLIVFGQSTVPNQKIDVDEATRLCKILVLSNQEDIIDWLLDEGVDLPIYDEKDGGQVNFEPKYPDSYKEGGHQIFPKDGVDKGLQPNTLTVEGVDFPFVPMYGNTGSEYNGDFEYMNSVIDSNQVVAVGQNKVKSFFGHYYDLSGNGVFNPLADQGLMFEGSEVIVTNDQGLSMGYEITQIVEFLNPEQYNYFYNEMSIPYLAYYGNQEDMVYIQYCRWDYELGLLISCFGYRVW